MRTTKALLDVHERMLAHFGPQGWWPGESPFEVMVGAMLTQNTSWQNVEKAIACLKEEGLLSPEAMSALSNEELAERIRSAGYCNLKAGRIKNLLALIEAQGSLDSLLALPTSTLREQLLAVKGIGPETADSILLYAADRPIFVVDAYTCRILSRHGLLPEEYDYVQVQELFMDNLEEDAALFNEYHALLVRTGKEFCRKSKPRCVGCPLANVA